MIRIAVIGGIGSGKSFISKLFNYPVFNADNEVKYIYKKNKVCFNQMRKKLPKFENNRAQMIIDKNDNFFDLLTNYNSEIFIR